LFALQAFNRFVALNLRLGPGFARFGGKQSDLGVPSLKLRIKFFFVCLSFVRHGDLLVVETFCLSSAFLASHNQQNAAAHERNSPHNGRQRKRFSFSAVAWGAKIDDFLSGRVGDAPVSERRDSQSD